MLTKSILVSLSVIGLIGSLGISLLTTPGHVAYTVNPSEFNNDSANVIQQGYRVSLEFGSDFPGFASLHLPDGVTVTKIIFYWQDSTATALCTVFLGKNTLMGSASNLAEVSTAGSANVPDSSYVDRSILIDNNFAYYLLLSCPNMRPEEIWLYGVTLEYTYPSFLSIIRK
jgi:hypothetical protein